jgi:hypothetical protein
MTSKGGAAKLEREREEQREQHQKLMAQVRRERELREQRAAWEKRRKFEREQAERQRKQDALKEYLDLRSGMYLDHTGSPPTQSQLASWTEDFISARVRRTQEEAEARRRAAIKENYDFSEGGE